MKAMQKTQDEVIGFTPENIETLMAHPLRAVPAELRVPVWSLWSLSQHLIASPLPISAAIATDITNGLPVEDAKSILESMAKPEVRSGFKFAGDLMAELARRNSIAIKTEEGNVKAAKSWCERAAAVELQQMARKVLKPSIRKLVDDELNRRKDSGAPFSNQASDKAREIIEKVAGEFST